MKSARKDAAARLRSKRQREEQQCSADHSNLRRLELVRRRLDAPKPQVDLDLTAMVRHVHHDAFGQLANARLAAHLVKLIVGQRSDHAGAVIERLADQLGNRRLVVRVGLRCRGLRPGGASAVAEIGQRDVRDLFAKAHLFRIRLETVIVGGHGIGDGQRKIFRSGPMLDELRAVLGWALGFIGGEGRKCEESGNDKRNKQLHGSDSPGIVDYEQFTVANRPFGI